jgi:WXXGXW repeat (2 copies)
MLRFASAFLAVSTMVAASGCVVRAQGRVRPVVVHSEPIEDEGQGGVVVVEEPPPPRYVEVQPRRGYIWIHGRWDRRGNQWVWIDGHWEHERANYVYRPGKWKRRGRGHVWIEGRWVVRGR